MTWVTSWIGKKKDVAEKPKVTVQTFCSLCNYITVHDKTKKAPKRCKACGGSLKWAHSREIHHRG